jgi:rhodanese-related sulfurtransferase
MILTVTPLELASLVAAEDVDMIDVRDLNEWETGYIPGSRLVPLPQFRENPEAHLRPGKTTVFICAKGVRSMAAAKLAERFGYERLYNLDGGTKAWTAHGLGLAAAAVAA